MRNVLPIAIIVAVLAFSRQTRPSPGYIPPAPPGPGDRELLEYLSSIAEETAQLPGLASYLVAMARRESRFNPLARNPKQGVSSGDAPPARRLFLRQANQNRYQYNPWIDDVDLWSYSGGLFGLMPATALSVDDGSAYTMAPTSVFVPEYAIAYATDLIVRLIRKWDARTWGEVRVGWAAPSLIDEPESDRYQAVHKRLAEDYRKTGKLASFIDDRVPSTRNYPGFQIVLNNLITHAKVA